MKHQWRYIFIICFVLLAIALIITKLIHMQSFAVHQKLEQEGDNRSKRTMLTRALSWYDL